MTMLDRMRRHRNWLKWSLGLVVLAFVIFYIPDFLQGTDPNSASNETVAVIEGEPIRADEFRRIYQAQLQTYRSAYGGKMSDQLLKQLGVEQQILQQLVDERAAMAEAQRLGLTVSDEEVAQRIFSFPAFQENGAFIGTARYQQVLASQRPPLTTAEFEENVRRGLAVDKLRASVTEWLSVSDKELEEEYRRRNDKIKLAVLSFNADAYRSAVTASDADVSAYFEKHPEDFRIPEKRKVKYVLIDIEAIRAKLQIAQADIERAYNDSIDQYTTPEQIRASHILLKTEGKDEAAVKAKAEDVLKQVKAGGDFAALARKFSEDEANAQNGGDLDFFGRGRMVPEFDTAAFALETGQVSDLVKTPFGFHIIKLTEKKPGSVRPLDEVKAQLTDQLGYERAQAQATTLAETLEPQIKKPADLDVIAAANGLTVQETGFFARNEPILGVGGSPEMAARAFSMKVGDVSGTLRSSRGLVFQTLTAVQESYAPKLDEVKDRVRDAVIADRATALAKQKATEIAAKLKTAPDFEKAAKAAGVEAKTTELLTRDQPRADAGAPAEVLDQAFKLTHGAVSDPIATGTGTVVVKVVEKLESTAEEITAKKAEFREEVLADRRSRFFNAYMLKAKEKMKIQVNREALQRVVG
jgi:peptidyl-prolyl cis-trans isomerase D